MNLADRRTIGRESIHGQRWDTDDSDSTTAHAPNGGSWFTLDHNPDAELVKSGRFRKVWRVTTPQGTRFAKVITIGGTVERLKALVIGSAAHREWRVLCALKHRGIPAVRPLAVGTCLEGAPQSALITEGVADAHTLTDVWQRTVIADELRERHAASNHVIQAVAQLLATAHNRGFVHRDTHPQNILIQHRAGAPLTALFVDVHGGIVTKCSPHTRKPSRHDDAVRSIAQLDHFFQRVATRAQRLRFLLAYARYRDPAWPPRQARSANVTRSSEATVARDGRASMVSLITDIQRQRGKHARRLARQRDRRLHGDGKYFAALRVPPTWHGRVALRLERRHVFPERAVKDRTIADWQSILSTQLARIEDQIDNRRAERTPYARDSESCTVVVQHARGALTRLRWLVSGSPARQAFLRSHRMRHRDVASELVLGYLQRSVWGLPVCCAAILPAGVPLTGAQTEEGHTHVAD